MGAVFIGDEVLGVDGKPALVISKSEVQYGRKCYRVHFSDKTSIVADAEHLWEVDESVRVRKPVDHRIKVRKVLTTEDMVVDVKHRNNSKY